MSYILDALKRADAERGRGAVPGLHTRQLASPHESNRSAPGARRALWLGLAGALALAGMGGGLWLWQTPTQAPVVVVARAVVTAPPARAALAPVAPTAPVKAAPVVSAPIKAKPEPTRAAPAVTTPLPAPAPSKAAPVAAAPANATSAALPLLSELPDQLRAQVPAITITGAVYAANPGQRLLLVNNLVLTQGALAAPELKLEEIQPRSSVFSFRGTRFRVAH